MNTPCLIVGDSGSGKSSSFRNLDPTKTVILNVERKSLPFRSFNKFKNIDVSKYKDFMKVMKELKDNDSYEVVVIDSLTSLIEIINKYCETVYSGYTVWKEYNDAIWNVLQDIKDLKQQVYVTAIPELIESEPGEFKAFAKVKAKEWKCAIEKEFTIVLHTHLVDDEEGNITDYQLDTRPSKRTSSKSPSEMFEERFIGNDVLEIASAIEKEFAIVLHTHLEDDEEGNITGYKLDTRPSKSTSAKSPNEMFEDRYIENDAVLVTEAIQKYYE